MNVALHFWKGCEEHLCCQEHRSFCVPEVVLHHEEIGRWSIRWYIYMEFARSSCVKLCGWEVIDCMNMLSRCRSSMFSSFRIGCCGVVGRISKYHTICKILDEQNWLVYTISRWLWGGHYWWRTSRVRVEALSHGTQRWSSSVKFNKLWWMNSMFCQKISSFPLLFYDDIDGNPKSMKKLKIILEDIARTAVFLAGHQGISTRFRTWMKKKPGEHLLESLVSWSCHRWCKWCEARAGVSLVHECVVHALYQVARHAVEASLEVGIRCVGRVNFTVRGAKKERWK